MIHALTILRRSAILAAVFTAFVCLMPAAAGAAPFAYTANYDADSLSVINTQTGAVVGEIAVGEGPSSIAMTPDGSRGFVANYKEDTVSAFRPATRKVIGKPIEVGEEPSVIAISPDGKTAYVSDEGSDEVTAINTATDAVIGSIAGVIDPYGLALSPDGKSVYVTSDSGEEVYVVDTATLKVVGEPIAVGEGPVTIVFDADGRTAYVADEDSEEVTAIDTATRETVPIEVGIDPFGLAITPDGSKLYVSNYVEGAVSVVDTALDAEVDKIPVGSKPFELGMTPDGKVVYVAEDGSEDVLAINTGTEKLIGEPIEIPGGPRQVVVAPDQSPTAAFPAPSAGVGTPALFDGSGSTDPDGTIASFGWAFGDGATATGVSVSHSYAKSGTFPASLGVVDNEGCSTAEVFTGRTAYCSGGASSTPHPVTVASPVAAPIAAPSNKFKLGRLIHNRRNGTARLQVRVPAAGSIVLFGKQVHEVRKKAGAAGSMWLTIHARVELNKRLKKIHRTTVKVRITFTPTGGTARTVHRSITLLHAPRKKK